MHILIKKLKVTASNTERLMHKVLFGKKEEWSHCCIFVADFIGKESHGSFCL